MAMETKQKALLGVGCVVLVAAGGLIYMNLKEDAPPPPVAAAPKITADPVKETKAPSNTNRSAGPMRVAPGVK